MSKSGEVDKLFETLAETLDDARHNYAVDKPKKAKELIELADKTIEAIKLASGEEDWQCREAHCPWKHNSRGSHE